MRDNISRRPEHPEQQGGAQQGHPVPQGYQAQQAQVHPNAQQAQVHPNAQQAHGAPTAARPGQAGAPTVAGQRLFDPRKYRSSFPRLVISEIRKITSLRSMRMTVGILFGISILLVGGIAPQMTKPYGGELNAEIVTAFSLIYMTFMLVIGTLAVTGEYASNTMRTTAASGSRTALLAAKYLGVLIVTGIVTGVLLVVLSAIAWVRVNNGALDSEDFATLARTWLCVVAFALMGTGVGYALRSTAGTITTLLGVLVLTPLLQLIPVRLLRETLNPIMPQVIANRIVSPINSAVMEHTWSPGASTVVWLVYLVILLAVGYVRFLRRDV